MADTPISECRECKAGLAQLLEFNPGWWCSAHGMVRADDTFLNDIRDVRAADKQRIAALESALTKAWAHSVGSSVLVRCALCGAQARDSEDYIQHRAGCIVRTLSNQGKEA